MSIRSLSRLLGAAALVLTLPLAAGCTTTHGEQTPLIGVAPPMKLVAFDSCDRLLTDLRTATRASIGPYGIPGIMGDNEYVRRENVRADLGGVAAPESSAASAVYSGTNNHEVDADEPDRVKTDGRRIVTISNGVLRVVDAASRTETGHLRLGIIRDTAELLLLGDHALVMTPLPGPELRYRHGPYGWPGLPIGPTSSRQQVLLVDLTGNPKIISKYVIDGSMVDARMTGNTARVVIRSRPQFATDKLPRNKATLESDYRKLVDTAPVEAWQPGYEVTTAGATTKGRVGCDRISRPADFTGTSMVTVLTFDIAANALGTGDPVSVVADGDTVYSTGASLYIVTDSSWRQTRSGALSKTAEAAKTEIHRFDTAGQAAPRYVASGTVPGRLINQYALSEWDGRLRVASTEDPIDSFEPESSPPHTVPQTKPAVSSSAIRVLQQQGGNLVEVGNVTGLGKGERIYAVRFVGPRGYVVTFRQTDPLYSVDLSNPTKPTLTGELKIPGYSSHLQPAGDGRLIGIGQDANSKGTTNGTQISLFDVANPADPKRLTQHQVPNGYSEAEHEPHALLWWPATNTLVVPMSTYNDDGEGTSTALVLKVTDTGITKLGEITQRPLGAEDGPVQVRRTLIVGDVLWTLSDNSMQASSLSTLAPLSWLPTP